MLTEFNLNKNEDILKQIAQTMEFCDDYKKSNVYVSIDTVKEILNILKMGSALDHNRGIRLKRLIKLESCYQNSPNYDYNKINELFKDIKVEDDREGIAKSLVSFTPATTNIILKAEEKYRFGDIDRFHKSFLVEFKIKFKQNQALTIHCIQLLAQHQKLTDLFQKLKINLVENSRRLDYSNSHELIRVLFNAKVINLRMGLLETSYPLLHHASINSSLPMLQTLIECGADLFELTENNRTAFQMAKESALPLQKDKASLLERSMVSFYAESAKVLRPFISHHAFKIVIEYLVSNEHFPNQFPPTLYPIREDKKRKRED